MLLLGDQPGPRRSDAQPASHRRILTMPVKSRQLREAVLRSLAAVAAAT